jgi:diguanylate cyclase (GGDEF)-like protein
VAGILEGAISESLSQISQLKNRSAELEGKITDLKREALRSDYDELTKALSRRGFITRAERFLALAREYETPCAMGFVDVDNFKALNDELGHDGGNGALVRVAERLCDHFRGRGIVGRVGGDEFAFLLIAKSRDEIAAEADRLTASFAGMSTAPDPAGRTLPLTTSIGVLWLGVPSPEQTPETAMKRADEVMHSARRTGRPQCVTAKAG